MKKLAFLLLAALTVGAASCGKNDTAAKATGDALAPEPFEATTNIRYVVQDSINNNYVYAVEVRQAVEKLEMEFMTYANKLDNNLQNMQADFEQKVQKNQFFTQQSAQAEYNKLQQTAASYQNLAQKKRAEISTQQQAYLQALQDSINNFLVAYNRSHKYDAIFYKETTLYLNPALDITNEIVDGLNTAYRPTVDIAPKAPEAAEAEAAASATPAK